MGGLISAAGPIPDETLILGPEGAEPRLSEEDFLSEEDLSREWEESDRRSVAALFPEEDLSREWETTDRRSAAALFPEANLSREWEESDRAEEDLRTEEYLTPEGEETDDAVVVLPGRAEIGRAHV